MNFLASVFLGLELRATSRERESNVDLAGISVEQLETTITSDWRVTSPSCGVYEVGMGSNGDVFARAGLCYFVESIQRSEHLSKPQSDLLYKRL